jgi:hypothetical protein
MTSLNPRSTPELRDELAPSPVWPWLSLRRSSLRQVDWISKLGLAGLALAFLIWVELWQYSLYAGGLFDYHDLTLITDCSAMRSCMVVRFGSRMLNDGI